MFSDTLSFLSSRNVSDQVSHPYKTTGKITVDHFTFTLLIAYNFNFAYDLARIVHTEKYCVLLVDL